MSHAGGKATAALVADILDTAAALPEKPRLMEVCGTHTAAIFRHGLRGLMKQVVEFVSGPGCPVCVTPDEVIDRAVVYARQGRIVATYGDMMRVPGTEGSLADARAEGADVRVVASPLAAVELAAADPRRTVIFLGVGFETTAPGTGLLLREVRERGLDNLYVFCAHKLIPPAMRALLSTGEQRIAGFLCPGHVSAVIGLEPYARLSAEFGVPCVVAGFTPDDILLSTLMLLRQLKDGRARAEIQYRSVVKPEGNPAALSLLAEVFRPADAGWRGLGIMAESGLALNDAYRRYDAETAFPVDLPVARVHRDCRCGEVLRGVMTPKNCPRFGRGCTPASPLGPCMVSSEGTCATYYAFDRT